MSNKSKSQKSKTKITKISATSETTSSHPQVQKAKVQKEKVQKAKTKETSVKTTAKTNKPTKKTSKTEKPLKQVFILARPFVALGRYLRDAWHELQQVRWPNRKSTWKMTVAVLIYCAIFFAFIALLDTLFTFIFNLLLTK